MPKIILNLLVSALLLFTLSACNSSTPASTINIEVSVSGLVTNGTNLIIQNSHGGDLNFSASGTQKIDTNSTSSTDYDIYVS